MCMRNLSILVMVTGGFLCLFCIEPVLGAKEEKGIYEHLKFVKEKDRLEVEADVAELIDLTKTNQAVLLKKAKERYEKEVQDYIGVLVKQEVVGGKLLKEQTIEFRFKEKPFSVYMEITKNAGSANRVLYVEGANDGKMVVHPTGLFAWIKSVKREPDCEAAMKENLYPCTMFGFGRMMEKAMAEYEGVKAGDLTMRYLGMTEVAGRRCVAGERLLAKGKGYETARLIVQIDVETLLPLDVRSFDWEDKLISRYSFSKLEINVGLKDSDFTKKACGF